MVVRLVIFLKKRNKNIIITNILASRDFTQAFQATVRFKASGTCIYVNMILDRKRGRKGSWRLVGKH